MSLGGDLDSRIRVTITALPDEDRMVAEIVNDGAMVAELIEGDELVLYPRPDGGPRSLPATLWCEAFDAARQRLDGMSRRRE